MTKLIIGSKFEGIVKSRKETFLEVLRCSNAYLMNNNFHSRLAGWVRSNCTLYPSTLHVFLESHTCLLTHL